MKGLGIQGHRQYGRRQRRVDSMIQDNFNGREDSLTVAVDESVRWRERFPLSPHRYRNVGGLYFDQPKRPVFGAR